MSEPTQADIERAEKMAASALVTLANATHKHDAGKTLSESLNLPQLLVAERENETNELLVKGLEGNLKACEADNDQLRADLAQTADALKAAVARVGQLEGQVEMANDAADKGKEGRAIGTALEEWLEECCKENAKLRKQVDAFNHWTSQEWRTNVETMERLKEQNAALLAVARAAAHEWSGYTDFYKRVTNALTAARKVVPELNEKGTK